MYVCASAIHKNNRNFLEHLNLFFKVGIMGPFKVWFHVILSHVYEVPTELQCEYRLGYFTCCKHTYTGGLKCHLLLLKDYICDVNQISEQSTKEYMCSVFSSVFWALPPPGYSGNSMCFSTWMNRVYFIFCSEH